MRENDAATAAGAGPSNSFRSISLDSLFPSEVLLLPPSRKRIDLTKNGREYREQLETHHPRKDKFLHTYVGSSSRVWMMQVQTQSSALTYRYSTANASSRIELVESVIGCLHFPS